MPGYKKNPREIIRREIKKAVIEHRTIQHRFNQYRDLPADPDRGNPLHAWGAVHAGRLGTYWTRPIDVPLQDLSDLHPVLQSAARLKSVQSARKSGFSLPPIELGVFRDGSAWIIDGNHRLIDARSSSLSHVPVIFTFVGT